MPLLDSPGYLHQGARYPVCEISNMIGCQQLNLAEQWLK